MIAAFFSRACDSREIFEERKISTINGYEKYRNKYAVISIFLNDVSGGCTSYVQYIKRIEKKLIKDLKRVYPEIELEEDEYAVDVLLDIYAEHENAQFIFILDEWEGEMLSSLSCIYDLNRIY